MVGNFNETCLAVILQDVTFHSRASLCNVMATDTIAQNSVIIHDLLIGAQFITLTTLHSCNKKVQCIFFDEMYQHIDAKNGVI